MTTVLVANRGEIALRVFRTAKRLAMRTVAVYSDADEGAPHMRAADVAVRIGPAAAGESYLRRDAILDAARATKADLIHPGYGFLAEDDRFARECEELGFIFVGPPAKVLAEVGDKIAVRRIAAGAGVPMLPAYNGEEQANDAFIAAANDIGYPVLVKPAGGGGGKGMTVVEREADLVPALESSRRVARAAFGDDRLLLERYLHSPRHVEVQVMADAHGNVVHLGERDCSLQRRHQKLMEESPAPNLDESIRTGLCDAAVSLAVHAGYVGAGTCEFLVGGDEFGFIEMNARLQVEHPVTEMVTGLDLVELQLGVALGEALPITRAPRDGHAIEVRIYAEDPAADFLPQIGRVLHVRWPADERVDSGIEEGTDVTPYYDPLLAKLTVHGEDRAHAVYRLQQALREAEILGPRTNLTFLREITTADAIVEGTVTTDWLESVYTHWAPSEDATRALAIAAAAETEATLAVRTSDPWTTLGAWRTCGAGSGAGSVAVVLRCEDVEHVVRTRGRAPFDIDGTYIVDRGAGCHEWRIDGDRAAAVRTSDAWLVWVGGAAHEIGVGPAPRRLATASGGRLESPLPGQVIAVRVQAGERVEEGAELVVVEAMKMEHVIRAPSAGVVKAVLCVPGDKVDRGRSLVEFEAE